MTDHLPAGEFGAWLHELAAALKGEGDTDVACGSCIGCCSSSQFILIEAHERDALAHIPAQLLFSAPRMPKGNMLLGYDGRGRCPMLSDQGCTIYEHRPRTCRTYDCRVFPAAEVFPDEPEKALIAERARQWQFTYADDADRALHDQVRAAARSIQREEAVPATAVAVRAARTVIDRT